MGSASCPSALLRCLEVICHGSSHRLYPPVFHVNKPHTSLHHWEVMRDVYHWEMIRAVHHCITGRWCVLYITVSLGDDACCTSLYHWEMRDVITASLGGDASCASLHHWEVMWTVHHFITGRWCELSITASLGRRWVLCITVEMMRAVHHYFTWRWCTLCITLSDEQTCSYSSKLHWLNYAMPSVVRQLQQNWLQQSLYNHFSSFQLN